MLIIANSPDVVMLLWSDRPGACCVVKRVTSAQLFYNPFLLWPQRRAAGNASYDWFLMFE
jgi:hypothetical protein